MSPAILSTVKPDCGLVKQPVVTAKPLTTTTVTKKGDTTTSSTGTKGSTTTTTTTTTTSKSYSGGEWHSNAPKETRSFVCEYPTVHANVNRVLEPLPFPKRLKDVIAWTDAFVDRIAIMTEEQEKATETTITTLTETAERYRTSAECNLVIIHEREETIREKNSKIDELQRLLAAANCTIERHTTTIKTQEKRIETLIADHRKEIEKWEAENRKDDKEIADGKAHIEHHHEEIKRLKIEAETKLREAHCELERVKTESAAKDVIIQSQTKKITELETKITELLAKIRKLEVDIQVLHETCRSVTIKYDGCLVTIEKLKRELEAAVKKAAEEKEKHDAATIKYNKTIETQTTTIRELTILKETLETKISCMQKEIKTLTDKIASLNAEVKCLTTEITTVKTTVRTSETKIEHLEGEIELWERKYKDEKEEWEDKHKDLERKRKNESDEWERKRKSTSEEWERKLKNESDEWADKHGDLERQLRKATDRISLYEKKFKSCSGSETTTTTVTETETTKSTAKSSCK